MSTSDDDYLYAIQELRLNLPVLLPAEQAALLEAQLRQILVTTEDSQRSCTITPALEAINKHAAARRFTRAIFEETSAVRSSVSFKPAPGLSTPIAPGPLVFCPKDPDHYQRHIRVKGQRLFCPDHGVELVPQK